MWGAEARWKDRRRKEEGLTEGEGEGAGAPGPGRSPARELLQGAAALKPPPSLSIRFLFLAPPGQRRQ